MPRDHMRWVRVEPRPSGHRRLSAERLTWAVRGLSSSPTTSSRVASDQYRVVLLKAWTKDTLAVKIQQTLEPYTADEIVSVEARVDFQFFWPWRRDWAMIVLKTLEPVE